MQLKFLALFFHTGKKNIPLIIIKRFTASKLSNLGVFQVCVVTTADQSCDE